ncbi:heme ABC exporter ATP-binding protein CcmA [Novosphingobium sp.]|uniref:heme ABC exporter ATP-binding protein CcmA n=1 Tax=Novosphingobium sp. TaxID=1874826 RepID=UPI0038B84942
MTVTTLSAQGLACRRGDRILFRGLDFALQAGEALHLAGPNGVGKSSLIRILAGLREAYAGTVERQGALALLDERPALDGHLPLGQALDFWRRIDRAQPQHAAPPLTTTGGRADPFGLDDLLDVPVRYLSTGQRKRAGLARLAASGAAIWLLDEPLNGLDAHWALAAQAAIAAHLAAGGLALIASHQPLTLDHLRTLALAEYAA